MTRVIITVPEILLQSVDAQARRSHKSRSALIRSALSEWLAARERAEFEELLAAGYQEMAEALRETAADYDAAQAEALRPTWRWE